MLSGLIRARNGIEHNPAANIRSIDDDEVIDDANAVSNNSNNKKKMPTQTSAVAHQQQNRLHKHQQNTPLQRRPMQLLSLSCSHHNAKRQQQQVDAIGSFSDLTQCYEEIDQIYDYVRGLAPLPTQLRKIKSIDFEQIERRKNELAAAAATLETTQNEVPSNSNNVAQESNSKQTSKHVIQQAVASSTSTGATRSAKSSQVHATTTAKGLRQQQQVSQQQRIGCTNNKVRPQHNVALETTDTNTNANKVPATLQKQFHDTTLTPKKNSLNTSASKSPAKILRVTATQAEHKPAQVKRVESLNLGSSSSNNNNVIGSSKPAATRSKYLVGSLQADEQRPFRLPRAHSSCALANGNANTNILRQTAPLTCTTQTSPKRNDLSDEKSTSKLAKNPSAKSAHSGKSSSSSSSATPTATSSSSASSSAASSESSALSDSSAGSSTESASSSQSEDEEADATSSNSDSSGSSPPPPQLPARNRLTKSSPQQQPKDEHIYEQIRATQRVEAPSVGKKVNPPIDNKQPQRFKLVGGAPVATAVLPKSSQTLRPISTRQMLSQLTAYSPHSAQFSVGSLRPLAHHTRQQIRRDFYLPAPIVAHHNASEHPHAHLHHHNQQLNHRYRLSMGNLHKPFEPHAPLEPLVRRQLQYPFATLASCTGRSQTRWQAHHYPIDPSTGIAMTPVLGAGIMSLNRRALSSSRLASAGTGSGPQHRAPRLSPSQLIAQIQVPRAMPNARQSRPTPARRQQQQAQQIHKPHRAPSEQQVSGKQEPAETTKTTTTTTTSTAEEQERRLKKDKQRNSPRRLTALGIEQVLDFMRKVSLTSPQSSARSNAADRSPTTTDNNTAATKTTTKPKNATDRSPQVRVSGGSRKAATTKSSFEPTQMLSAPLIDDEDEEDDDDDELDEEIARRSRSSSKKLNSIGDLNSSPSATTTTASMSDEDELPKSHSLSSGGSRLQANSTATDVNGQSRSRSRTSASSDAPALQTTNEPKKAYLRSEGPILVRDGRLLIGRAQKSTSANMFEHPTVHVAKVPAPAGKGSRSLGQVSREPTGVLQKRASNKLATIAAATVSRSSATGATTRRQPTTSVLRVPKLSKRSHLLSRPLPRLPAISSASVSLQQRQHSATSSATLVSGQSSSQATPTLVRRNPNLSAARHVAAVAQATTKPATISTQRQPPRDNSTSLSRRLLIGSTVASAATSLGSSSRRETPVVVSTNLDFGTRTSSGESSRSDVGDDDDDDDDDDVGVDDDEESEEDEEEEDDGEDDDEEKEVRRRSQMTATRLTSDQPSELCRRSSTDRKSLSGASRKSSTSKQSHSSGVTSCGGSSGVVSSESGSRRLQLPVAATASTASKRQQTRPQTNGRFGSDAQVTQISGTIAASSHLSPTVTTYTSSGISSRLTGNASGGQKSHAYRSQAQMRSSNSLAATATTTPTTMATLTASTKLRGSADDRYDFDDIEPIDDDDCISDEVECKCVAASVGDSTRANAKNNSCDRTRRARQQVPAASSSHLQSSTTLKPPSIELRLHKDSTLGNLRLFDEKFSGKFLEQQLASSSDSLLESINFSGATGSHSRRSLHSSQLQSRASDSQPTEQQKLQQLQQRKRSRD